MNTHCQIEKRVKLKITDEIAFVSLNRADKHNALDLPMFHAIKHTIKKLRKNRTIRAVIVEGIGSDFCSGIDVQSVKQSVTGPLRLLAKWLPWRANLAQFVSVGWSSIPVPVIMVIEGRCWGGGLQIALGGDFRIATPDASISIMEARWGLIPDMGGTLAVRDLLTKDIAKVLTMSGQVISAVDAQKFGLLTYIDDNPREKALTLASSIKNQSPDSVAGVKKLYNKSWQGNSGLALARESLYQIKILLGKNWRRKAYNQVNPADKAKDFLDRGKW